MEEPELSATESLGLGLSRTYYLLARALRLNKLRDLLNNASINLDATVWLLGRRYAGHSTASEAEQEEVLARMLHHFQSILWMTYRTSFTPIAVGDVQLRSDAGWGCTLRSGQMILAQGLQRHLLGPHWRWSIAQQRGAEEAPPPQLARLLQLFWDTPAERNAFSIHNLCLHGRRCGVVPGRWLGPWVMCKTLEAAAEAAAAAAATHHQPALGVTVAVLAEAGGGAPLLVVSRFELAFSSRSSNADGGSIGEEQQQENKQALAAAAAAAAAPTELLPVDSGTLAVETLAAAAAEAATGKSELDVCGSSNGSGGGSSSSSSSSSRGLILLVPLVLGLGKLNPRYIPQLEAVLAMPQSIGIIGGRPSSSLYFVGCQAGASGGAAAMPAPAGAAAGQGHRADGGKKHANSSGHSGSSSSSSGSSVIYLDPHQVQEAACSDGDWLSFRCEAPRTMPLASIDPSLALGFYCGSLEEYHDLCDRLAVLERQSGGAPLVCVTAQEAPPPHGGAAEWVPDELTSLDSEGDEEEEEAEEGSGEEACLASMEHHHHHQHPHHRHEQQQQQQQQQQQAQDSVEEEPVELPPEAVREAAAAIPSPPRGPPRSAAPCGGPGSPAEQPQPQNGSTAAAAGAGADWETIGSSPRQHSQPLSPAAAARQASRGWELL